MSIPDLNPELLTSGKLDQHPLVELLGISFAHRRSGRLLLKRGRTTVTINLFNGIPVNAASSSPVQGILELMVHDHRLQPDDVLQVKKLAESKGMDIERCLRELLEVTESQIYYYRQQAVRNIIIKDCGWRDGFYSFEPGDDFMSEIDMYDLNPLDLIYEGINKYRSQSLAADIHAIESRTLVLNQQNRDYFLLPGPLYDHSDILDIFADGIQVASAVSAMQQEFNDINLAVTLIYLLLLTGIVVFPPEISSDEIFDDGDLFYAPSEAPPAPTPPPRPAEPDGPEVRFETSAPPTEIPPVETTPAATPEPENLIPADESSVYVIAHPRKLKKKPQPTAPAPSVPERARPAAARAPTPPPPPPARPVPAPPPKPEPPARAPSPAPMPVPAASAGAGAKPSPEERFKRVSILAQEIQSAPTLYDVLGATVVNDIPQLQKFFAARRRLLLDGMEGSPEPTRSLVEQALVTLENAFTRMTDPARRVEYERILAGEENKRAWNLNMKKLLAKKMGDRGRWYLLANAPEHARAFYQEAVELDADNPIYYMELGWAIFRHRPQEVDEARSYLLNAVKIDPTQDKAYYYLGVIAKRRGENELAENMLRRTLTLNPEHESARRELAYLNQHQKETGLWKKIFGG